MKLEYRSSPPTLGAGTNNVSPQCDSQGNLKVAVVTAVSSGTLSHGTKAVTTAGTAVVLAASTACNEVLIQATRTNTGRIYIGGAAVPNTDTGGVYLTAGQSVNITADNLADIYINSTVNGESVGYIYR